jgi:hypothetical protein
LLVIGLLLTIFRRLKRHPCGWRRSRPNTGGDLIPTIVAADVVQCGPPPSMSPDEPGPPPSTGAPVRGGAECDVQRFFADGGGGGDGDCASLVNDHWQLGEADGGATDFFGTGSVQIDMEPAFELAPPPPASATPAQPPPPAPTPGVALAYTKDQQQEMTLPPPPYVDDRQRLQVDL